MPSMARSLLLPLLSAAPVVYSLPWPVATTYNSIDLGASVEFLVNFWGAEEIQPNITISDDCDASMRWVRMPGSGYEFHFISTPSLATANFSFPDYVAYVEALYGNLSEVTASSYDQFMDFHVGMITDDMTPFYQKLTENNVPFFMVGQYPAFFDLFVEIPGTGAILEVTSQRLDYPNATISLWDICQVNGTDTAEPATQTAGSSFPINTEKWQPSSENTTLPIINWRKTTFAAPHPADAEDFSIRFLQSVHIEQGHPGVWTRHCARIAWTEFEYTGPAGIPYQFHFVDGYKYPPYPPAMNIVDFAEFEVENRDFEDNQWDEWANNRLTMWVDDLTPYLAFLDSYEPTNELVPFQPQYIIRKYEDDSLYSVIVDITPIAGHVIELVSNAFPTDTYPQVSTWDFC